MDERRRGVAIGVNLMRLLTCAVSAIVLKRIVRRSITYCGSVTVIDCVACAGGCGCVSRYGIGAVFVSCIALADVGTRKTARSVTPCLGQSILWNIAVT